MKQNQKGITLVGLLITVIVIAIIGGVCIYTGRDILEEAKQTELETNLLLIQAAGKNRYDKHTLDENIPLVGTEILYQDKVYYVLDKDNLNELGVNIIANEVEGILNQEKLKTNNNLYIINYETNDVKYLANLDLSNFSLEGMPLEYQRVEYIESTGTQYIDTGYVPHNNTIVKCKMNYAVNTAFGAQNNVDKNTFAVAAAGKAEYIRYLGIAGVSIASGLSSSSIYELEIYPTEAVYTDSDGRKTTITYSPVGTTPGCSIYLFARNSSDSVLANSYSARKIYYFKIYNGDILVRNFVPCYRKADNVVGLYDIVEEKFYTNLGTGSFAKGNDIVE